MICLDQDLVDRAVKQYTATHPSDAPPTVELIDEAVSILDGLTTVDGEPQHITVDQQKLGKAIVMLVEAAFTLDESKGGKAEAEPTAPKEPPEVAANAATVAPAAPVQSADDILAEVSGWAGGAK